MSRRFDFVKHERLAVDWSPVNGVPFGDDSVLGKNHYQWICHNGHDDFRATLVNRATHGSGCPKCGRAKANVSMQGQVRIPQPGKAIADQSPALVAMFDLEKNDRGPDEIGTGYEKSVWWRCDRNHSWQATPNSVIASLRGGNTGCKPCSFIIRKQPKPGQSLGHLYPNLVTMWHPTKNGELTAFEVRPNSADYAFWLCERGHETHAIISSRSSGYGCVHCRQFNKSKVEDDFRTAFAASSVLTGVEPTAHRMAVDWSNKQDRQWMTVDIFGYLRRCPEVGIVIEYDGKYFHDRPEVSARELPKTQALLDVGHVVVRIRENGLAPVGIVHPRLLQVDHAYLRNDTVNELAPTVRAVEGWLNQLDVAVPAAV